MILPNGNVHVNVINIQEELINNQREVILILLFVIFLQLVVNLIDSNNDSYEYEYKCTCDCDNDLPMSEKEKLDSKMRDYLKRFEENRIFFQKMHHHSIGGFDGKSEMREQLTRLEKE